MGHNWKGLGTKGFKTNRKNELGKYFARLQKQKLPRPSKKCFKMFRRHRNVNYGQCKRNLKAQIVSIFIASLFITNKIPLNKIF